MSPTDATPPNDDRLDSWKEIAAYLRRDERTVRRWERTEGLPVHRHAHQKQSSVYAFRSELDAWRAARKPEGRLEDDGPDAGPEPPAVRGPDTRLVFGALGAVLLVAVAVYHVATPAPPPANGRVMLAVLPFANMGPPEQDYFSDGLTEELITQLARLNPDRLGVIARTTVMPYKGAPKDLRQIGRDLSVTHILEGSVRRTGSRARVTAQLIAMSDGSHVWADAFERDLADVFSIQIEIARQVARHMAVELMPGADTTQARVPTSDPEAHQAYLRARYEWNRRTADGLRRAREAFQQAIAADPGYAEAYAGLAGVYSLLGFYSVAPPQEVFPRARSAAQKALEIEPTLGEAWASLGFSKAFFDGDLAGARADFERAIELDPNQATPHHWYALWHLAQGRFREALDAIDRGRAIEPLSPIINANRAFILTAARRLDEAVAQCRTVLELDGDFHYAYWMLGLAYDLQGDRVRAAEALRRAIDLSGGNPSYRASLGYVLARAGHVREARTILDEIQQASRQAYVPPFYTALIYAGLDDRERAVEWLGKAVDERSGSVRFLKIDSRFDHLRADPRFVDLLRRLGLA